MDAQCDGKYIITIAKKPAIEYLASRYRLQGGLLSVYHPFVIYPERGSQEHYFRDVVRYCEVTGRLESLQLLPAQCQIQLTQPDPAAILAVSRKNIHQAMAHFPGESTPAVALWFSCVTRALVLENDAANEFKTATEAISSELPVAGFYTYGEIAPSGATGHNTYHSSTLVTLLMDEEPLTRPGIFGIFDQQRQFSQDNLVQDNKALTQALASSRAEVQGLQRELAEYRALGRIAAHSKTEQNAYYRALALQLVCGVLDTLFADFKRLAMKGNPPKLNKLGLARMVNDMHQKQYGKPFPLTIKQLASLMTANVDDNSLL